MPEPCCQTCGVTVSQHPASPCLDAWVLEDVLGYQRVEGDAIPEAVSSRAVPVERRHQQRAWLRDDGTRGISYYCEECGNAPLSSTDIAAAWSLFQHVMAKSFSTRMRFFSALTELARSPCGVPQGLWALQVLKDEFPLAICRAALLATH